MSNNPTDIYARNRLKTKEPELQVESRDNKCYVGNSIYLEVRCGDNIMVLEDKFKSSYDCKTCDGTGRGIKDCLKCNGIGHSFDHENKTELVCGRCGGTGKVEGECKDCNGKGALIEIPDEAKSRPTSGRIVSTGPDVKYCSIGERVAYTGYTGHLVPFKGNNRIRVMREIEAICFVGDIEGASQSKLEEVQFIDKDNAYDVQ